MKRLACSRRWEVEAVRDGRLQGKDAESLTRHLLSCVECASEERELEALSRGVREVPVRPADELSVRRQRQGLLLALERSFETNAEPLARRSRLAWGAGLTALVVASVVGVGVGLRSPAKSPGIVEVTAAPGAVWHEAVDHDSVRLSVDDGQVSFRIHRTSSAEHVLIVLPDGEIEDLGTVLSVRVNAHVTREIQVQEGRVKVRLRDAAELQLGAGQSWSRSETPFSARSASAPPSSTPLPPPLAADQSSARLPSALPAVVPRALGTPPRAVARSSEASSTSQLAKSSATRATNRAEDDAYLAIVSLLEQGKTAEARAAARDYFARFPQGFRRTEVADVVKR